MKWSSSKPDGLIRRFHVKVKPLKLEGFCKENVENNEIEKGAVSIGMKWKGPSYRYVFLPFYRSSSKRRCNYTGQKFLNKGEFMEWEDEFECICEFSVVPKDGSFAPWEVSFRVLYGESAESKTKPKVVGKVLLNIADGAAAMESQFERKLPVALKIDGVKTEANLLVSVNIADVRNSNDSPGIGQNSGESGKGDAFFETVRRITGYKKKNKKEKEEKNQENRVSSCGSDESVVFDSDHRSSNPGNESGSCTTSSDPELDPVLKDGRVVSWRKRRLNCGTPRRTTGEPCVKKSRGDDKVNADVDRHISSSSSFGSLSMGPAQKTNTIEFFPEYSWEAKEIISRDGKATLKSNVYYASFDQRSEKASGESACAVIATVVANWLHSNQNSLPTRSEFDTLIKQASSLWQNLCKNESYLKSFPDKHFDLETVLQANLNPITICPSKSFTGFFSPEKFEFLRGAMSFDEIWDEISSDKDCIDPRIYIVSWNDHFFVMKVDEDVCYIIDSLGTRLFDGCKKAYILKFDDSSLLYGNGEMICRGKGCCKEYIKRFLAKTPLEELEVEQKKGTVDPRDLLGRLQIDIHYTSPLGGSSSVSSSSEDSSTLSLFSGDESTKS